MKTAATHTTFSLNTNEHRVIVIDQPGQYSIELLGDGAEATVKGAFLVTHNSVVNVSVIIHHKAPHTRARTVLKGVVGDKARLSFKGKIIIDEDCSDTQSFLTERILLISSTASAEAIPELEILSDDVKCSHAASVSKISENHLFYFQSRGIDRATATKILTDSFLAI